MEPPDAPDLVARLHRLVTAGDAAAAARLWAEAGVDRLSESDIAELRVLAARLESVVDEVPEALLVHAQVIEQSLYQDERAALLDRLVTAATERGDSALVRAAHAEQARDLIRNWQIDDCLAVAADVLAHVGAAEGQTRSRALSALGGAYAFRRAPGDAARAESVLRESAALARHLDLRTAEAQALAWLGYVVLFPEGDDDQAIQALTRALAVAVPGSGIASVARASLASVLLGSGQLDAAATHLRAVEDEARAKADTRSLGWVAWTWARHSAYRHDGVAFMTHLDSVDRYGTEWSEAPEGLEFLVEASLLAQSLGDDHTALRYLERAEERARADGLLHMVEIARAGYEARFGDPHRAVDLLAHEPPYPALLRRDRWLLTILRALATERRGDKVEARRLAAAAIDSAENAGHADLLLNREPTLASRIIALAVAGGSSAAIRLASIRQPEIRVALFGRFKVEVKGVNCTPTGQPAVLVKRVALNGGTATIDQVIDWLWPDEPAAVGRRRVRNLLNRLRSMSGDIIVRDDDRLRIPDASIDLVTVETALDRWETWAPDAPESVREVWHLITGPLLADDPYESWAHEAHGRLSLRLAAAADRMAADADLRSDVPGVAAWLERGVALEPYDLDRQVKLVDALSALGDGTRLEVARRRALRVFAEMGQSPPATLGPPGPHRASVPASVS